MRYKIYDQLFDSTQGNYRKENNKKSKQDKNRKSY